ncbi:hypothetical protein GCM10012288_17710 [Malaciobacter pacificus]|uniref:DNA polymerase III subunit gamma/tau n=1 Tax=Malaciobacter pacificus TaxID=1080223 RepID=A0A5C2H8K7_9BACT|nr:DNA polymerase III subunit gamma/tau [Malaciobacter pacificus]QEP35300.1 DNA polymerase III, gamma and tau subunits [Malaciobacter pacificus]GGD43852.1 hypothetical protein GCM10012288_17710 [Malaciobacter pacificus]
MSEQIEKRVLALKYRPKRFEDLVGQSTVSQTLSLALDSSRLSHAYLFSGLRGSGKTSTARIMAKALLCTNGPTSKPCEVCDNCVSANSNRHLDIIEMDAASNRGIDDIKDLIEHTKYKPSSARFKVFIIDEVHMLTTQAFNALLKTLEEPPGFVKFILATTDPLKLPATILSRTQHFRFNKIAQNDVIHHLSHILNEENIDFDKDALEILARTGQGSLRDTLTLLDQAIIFSKARITTSSVVDMLGLIDPTVMDNIFSVVLNKGDINPILKELEVYEVSQICDEMTIYLKDKMLSKDPRFDLLLFDRFFRVLSDAKHLLSINSDSGFVLLLTLMKLVEATNIKTIDDIINQVQNISVKETTTVITPSVTPTVQESTPNVQKEIEPTPFVKEEIKAPIEHETKIEEPTEADLAMAESVIDLGVVDAIETVNPFEEEQLIQAPQKEEPRNDFSTPFDATPFDEEPTQDKLTQEKPVEQLVENIEPKLEEKVEEKLEKEAEVNSNELVQEPMEQQVKVNHNEEIEVVALESFEDDPSLELYEQLTAKIYDRDFALGECFEKNFIYNGFENRKLNIISYAQDDDRKFLYKHFGVIKTFALDTFGHDIELDFKKEEPSVLEEKKTELKVDDSSKDKSYDENNSNDSGSMIEDIEVGSGCVADMQKTSNPTLSQRELELNDIINSKMLDKAKELLDVRKITVKTRS